MNPIILELKEGSYYWCSCGKSKSQLFCDGSHKGSKFNPLEFKISEEKKVALCNCKHTKTAPFCDGAHKNSKG
ncbi:MAG: CDGSH iron-sulfur domain-containing protein [Nitrospirae bacterium]|nr:CDGSH iron-sulfur domain-containing protein [Nitrospirota bacterium]